MRPLVRHVRLCSMLALALLLGACAKNGNFDPTEFFSSDMFDTKKRLQGERKELFPNGVPGATTGVPADLVKGYQAPPEPAVATQPAPEEAAAATAEAAAAEPPKPKPAPKPKKKVARAPANDPIWDQKPASKPTQIDVSRTAPQPAAPQPPQQAAAPWPDPPAPKQAPGASVWPDPPPPGTFSR